ARSRHAYPRRGRCVRNRRALGVSGPRLLRKRCRGSGRLPLCLLPGASRDLGDRLRLFRGRRGNGRPRTARGREACSRGGRLSPMFMSVLAFATGAMLLVSGATPTFTNRLVELSLRVPLWALEASHFLGSIIGVVFLFVARGLLGRRDGAWKLALALSALSLVFSILKGLAFGEAAVLLLFTVLLLATRQQFYRPTSMFDQPFTWGWLAAVAGIVAASFGILFLF